MQIEIWTMKLIPDRMILESDRELTQYDITDEYLVWRDDKDPTAGVMMVVHFKRRITNELLTTYLPSILLMLITYATTFFKSIYFEAALTVNLTNMLVMTTIFISVMEKLPPTSYVEMVDYWLIFGQLIPFTEVALLTIIESQRKYENEDEDGVKTRYLLFDCNNQR